MKINLYDFDKTIYDGDSTVDFIFYCIKRKPKIIRRAPLIGWAAFKYLIKKNTKTQMKEVIFTFVKDIEDIDLYVKEFWETHTKNIKDFYMKKDHKNDIIISASPEFLLNPMKKYLKVLDLMATRANKKTGSIDGLNCHGEEKVRRLNEKYNNYEVIESYSDSLSDTPILKLAKNAYIVKGNSLKEYK